MNDLTTNVKIKTYKHNGQLHRKWHDNKILEQTEQRIIGLNDQTKVTDYDGSIWFTREPAIFFFYSEYWFNVIAMFKEDGIHYYCNLSSPYTVDDEAIRYIDYDLDIKVFPDQTIQLVDEDEYEVNKKRLHYPPEVDEMIKDHVSYLYKLIKNRQNPFSDDYVRYWYNQSRR